MSISDSWYHNKIYPDGEPIDGCHPDEAKTLQQYHEKKITAQEAAQAITRPVAKSSEPKEVLPYLWGLLQDAMLEWPISCLPELISLLSAIHDLPDEAIPDISGKFWRDLPDFAPSWGDTQCSLEAWDCPYFAAQKWKNADAAEFAKARETYVRFAEIDARMAVSDSLAQITVDAGYACMADALEVEPKDTREPDAKLLAATRWIIIAGKDLHRGALEERQSRYLNTARGLWHAGNKVSKERWAFWKERFAKAASERSDEATRAAAEEAKNVMDAIDKA